MLALKFRVGVWLSIERAKHVLHQNSIRSEKHLSDRSTFGKVQLMEGLLDILVL